MLLMAGGNGDGVGSVGEGMMAKMVVVIANECLSGTFSTVKIEIIADLIACSLLTHCVVQ
jgi:hypothetical protein